MTVARKGRFMTNTVIKIEGLGKKYLLAHKSPQRYIALRDVLIVGRSCVQALRTNKAEF